MNKTQNNKNYEYTPCTLLQTDCDYDCWVYGVVLKRTAKRYFVYNALRQTTQYCKHVKFDEVNDYKGNWEQTIQEAKGCA